MVISKERIFIYAILISVIWHIFWLCMIKVVVTPVPDSPVRFSRVSFLGPILAKRPMSVRVEPKTHSFLERRYMRAIGDMAYQKETDELIRYNAMAEAHPSDSDKIISMVDEAVSGTKLQPN